MRSASRITSLSTPRNVKRRLRQANLLRVFPLRSAALAPHYPDGRRLGADRVEAPSADPSRPPLVEKRVRRPPQPLTPLVSADSRKAWPPRPQGEADMG